MKLFIRSKYSPVSKNKRLEKTFTLRKQQSFVAHFSTNKILYSPVTSFTPIPMKENEGNKEYTFLQANLKKEITSEKATGIPDPNKYQTSLIVHFIRSKRLPYTYKHRELISDHIESEQRINSPINLSKVTLKRPIVNEVKGYEKIKRFNTMIDGIEKNSLKKLQDRIKLDRNRKQLFGNSIHLFQSTLKYKCYRNISFNLMLKNKSKTSDASNITKQERRVKGFDIIVKNLYN